MPVARNEPDPRAVAADHQAEPVVLDFVHPAGAGGRALGAGRKAGLDKAGNTQHARVLGHRPTLCKPQSAPLAPGRTPLPFVTRAWRILGTKSSEGQGSELVPIGVL